MSETYRSYRPGSGPYRFYAQQHRNQTIDFARAKISEYSRLDRRVMRMRDALQLLDDFVDPSDPDLQLPNSIHAYQTAEMIRADRPDDTELQITGLIHDLGKVLYDFGEPAWAVVGDTYPLGCPPSDRIVCYDTFDSDSDSDSTPPNANRYGIYQPNCGIRNLVMTFGHDEYLYQVLRGNQHSLPDRYLQMIRFHSFYPWHTDGAYEYLTEPSDNQILEDVRLLNRYDLYSKTSDFTVTDRMRERYDDLLDRYFPEPLRF